ncbi:MAG: SRPBCC family protein [Fimbriimonadaceae bacterium]|jgi:hypothetical protein|nr:SRPBCC family protein [Fimbriimonadaceae bacterium]
MAKAEAELVIACRPTVIWKLLSDLESIPSRQKGVTKIEMLTEGAYGVGTQWRESRSADGLEVTMTLTVAACDEGRSTTITCTSDGFDFSTQIDLSPLEEGTRVQFVTTIRAKTFKKKALLPVVARVIQRGLQEDLRSLAAEAEGQVH